VRWTGIIALLRKLKDQGQLRPDWEKWLPIAEQNLAKLKKG
jgi:hypothetical protein